MIFGESAREQRRIHDEMTWRPYSEENFATLRSALLPSWGVAPRENPFARGEKNPVALLRSPVEPAEALKVLTWATRVNCGCGFPSMRRENCTDWQERQREQEHRRRTLQKGCWEKALRLTVPWWWWWCNQSALLHGNDTRVRKVQKRFHCGGIELFRWQESYFIRWWTDTNRIYVEDRWSLIYCFNCNLK